MIDTRLTRKGSTRASVAALPATLLSLSRSSAGRRGYDPASRKRATSAVVLAQLSTSTCSCFVPVAVSE